MSVNTGQVVAVPPCTRCQDQGVYSDRQGYEYICLCTAGVGVRQFLAAHPPMSADEIAVRIAAALEIKL